MAGTTSINEKIVVEIEKLKAVARCKIITNVGEFTHLITATVPDTEVLIKYQLTGLCRWFTDYELLTVLTHVYSGLYNLLIVLTHVYSVIYYFALYSVKNVGVNVDTCIDNEDIS